MITVSIIVLAVIVVITFIFWIFHRKRLKEIQNLNQKYTDTIEYLQDNNYVRAEEQCKEALTAAEKLRDKAMTSELSDYLKLIEAVNTADDAYSGGKYEEAQSAYVTARERSRYSDHIADSYIDKQLQHITDYLSVFDYIQLGDTLVSEGDYTRAEEKYLQAKSLATRTYFEDGRKEAMDALEKMYTERDKAEEADTQEAKAKASEETGATELMSHGDKAFADGDYEGAKAYYALAMEKYQQLGDTAHADLLSTKINSSSQKAESQKAKERDAENYMAAAMGQEAAKEYMEAKKQYLFAKNIYKELKQDDKVTEVDGKLELLDAIIEQDKAEKESLAESESAEEAAAKDDAKTGPAANETKEIGPGITP